MGQNYAFTCKNSDQSIIAHQIKIYQWRAHPNFNCFIPRVYFKSALAQRQQERFSEFLQHQQQSQYLDISKFKQKIQSVEYSVDHQIIIFQKYFCSLAQLKGTLTIEEALYALQALLFGFQEIKKVFQTVIVDPSCCFVTSQGNIRAWVNPNAKSNHVWKQHFGEINLQSIIDKIVKIAEDSAIPSNKSLPLFQHLHHYMNFQPYYSFFSLRKWLSDYCYSQNIQIGKFINFDSKRKQQPLVRDSAAYKRSIRTNECSETQKENNQLFLTAYPSKIFKNSKVLQNGEHSIFQIRSNLPQESLKKSNTTLQLSRNPYQTHSKNSSNLQSMKCSVLVQTQFEEPFKSMQNSKAPKKNMKQYNELKKNSSTQFFSKEKESKKSSFLEGYKNPLFLQKKPRFLLSSNKLMEKNIDVMIDRPSIRKDTRKIQKYNQCSQKKSKLSIKQHFPQQNQIRKQIRYNTFAQNQHKQRQQSNNSVYFSRTCIKNKTISKLISDNDEMSVKQSVGQLSDYYNGSVYSGVLTQMGRQVGKPIDLARSKTLKESQL